MCSGDIAGAGDAARKGMLIHEFVTWPGST